MKKKTPTSPPEILSTLFDECFPTLPDGEFPRPPSLPRGGCFPQREPRAGEQVPKKRLKRKGAGK